ncbi:MAG TPA: hypothetical protein VFH55_06990 [Nitrospiria bacterium]|nr:hypothetical protein [Nitrospirota bacterium]HET6465337.1 hypothetical protein [Nitrospiria bacterium]
MKCPKCNGLMFIERFADYFLTFHAWKCVNCGAIMDQTILSNRAKGAEMELMLQTVPTDEENKD